MKHTMSLRQGQYGVVGIELENICAEEGAVSRTR